MIKCAVVLEWENKPRRHTEAARISLENNGYRTQSFLRNGSGVDHGATNRWIRQHGASRAVAFQRLYQSESSITEALHETKAQTLFMDFGMIPFAHYGCVIFDPVGGNATSEIVSALDRPKFVPAIEKHLADVDKMAESVRAMAAKAKPPDLPNPFAVLVLQKRSDNVVRYDADQQWHDPERMSNLFVKACRAAGFFAVVKPHPFDKQWVIGRSQASDCLIMHRQKKGAENDALNAWLMLNAAQIVTVNSTLVFDAMYLDRPVAMLGRSWATGNAVLYEAKDMTDALYNTPAIEWERRKRFLALLLSRHATEDQLNDPAIIETVFQSLCNGASRTRPKRHHRENRRRVRLQQPQKVETEPKPQRPLIRPVSAFCYLAMGVPHWEAFVASVRSLRQHEPNARIIVITNLDWPLIQPKLEAYGVEAVPIDFPSSESRAVKTRLIDYLPDDIEQCIYLDADTTITAPIREIFQHLNHYDFACCFDPVCSTTKERAKRRSPQLTQAGVKQLCEATGMGALMPQAGFLAWNRCDAARDFYADWHALWREQSENAKNQRARGDSAAFALALWRSKIRHEMLPPNYWHAGQDSGACIEHAWSTMSRVVTEDAPHFPTITTIYIPEPENERYPDTVALVKRCMREGRRSSRFVCIDKAPDDLRRWFELQGHEVVVLDAGRPPRMASLIGKALEQIASPYFWTVEQDVVLSSDVAKQAEKTLAGLSDNVAGLGMKQKGAEGNPVQPSKRGEGNWIGFREDDPTVANTKYIPYCCTLWRTAALRDIPWQQIRQFHGSDRELGKLLDAKGLDRCESRILEVTHYPHSSYTRANRSGKE